MKSIEEVLEFQPKTVKEIRDNNSDLMFYRNTKKPFRVDELNEKLKSNYYSIKSVSDHLSTIKNNEFKGKGLVIKTYYWVLITGLFLLSAYVLCKFY